MSDTEAASAGFAAYRSDSEEAEAGTGRMPVAYTGLSSDDDDDHQRRSAGVCIPPPAALGHSKVVETHYNTIEEKGLAERTKSRIVYMRNFNNCIKSVLINEFITRIREASKFGDPLRVLDMCCGKGGDLYKWEKGNITHLICTDIAAVSVDQCRERYQTMVNRHQGSAGHYGGKYFKGEFFACDSTTTRLRQRFEDPAIELNLVSCQFAFHYCFESLPQAECMIRNAAECLRTGGYFIGTIPDAYELVRRQRLAGSLTYGNSLYEIRFMCDADDPPLFGAKYNFRLEGVVDCPEFLVHFPLFVKLARKHGLRLVLKESFGSYYRQNANSARGLMERMRALQTFPVNPADEPADQFQHAADFMESQLGGDRHKKCGTLSKDEWEATSIYIVFAFQKLEKKYDEHNNLYFD